MEKDNNTTKEVIKKKIPKTTYIIISVLLIIISIIAISFGSIRAAIGPSFLALILLYKVRNANS